jgi:hypothetical protein
VSTRRIRILVLSALSLGAGLASASTALVTYFTRYSRFDALFGEVDATLYAQITQMAPAEKAALVAAALLIAASLAGLLTLLRRPTMRE